MTRRNEHPIQNEPELGSAPGSPRALESSNRLRSRIAIARAIIEARLARGWTQQQLAEVAGTKQSRISELESVRGNPTLETIERVASALGLELSLHPPIAPPQPSFSKKGHMATVFVLGTGGPEMGYQVEAEKFEEVPIAPAVRSKTAGALSRYSRLA